MLHNRKRCAMNNLSNARLCDLEYEKNEQMPVASCRLNKISLLSAQSASCPKVEQRSPWMKIRRL